MRGMGIGHRGAIEASSLKDKVTIAQQETICNMWNGTMFVDLD